ncbi:hypothetical protein [[Clostridium] hylemonae]|uniref:Uncharacterized protein n=1 Tax=[Clostridium] hylemonae DSM 15053 TaxID=553973 RepID=C0C1H5_9FIRM|nr:hypothetical protein [[Clostridium] hylemonae]EEG73989.1 hypothetical protein CLOHYLEM_05995 [[Clostridium] hylemonae DSM 15053]QEK19378.1 hypothetical protein LAJLEIBI_03410 [[Clostridium] hylemonae DSM 15053]
MDREKEKKLEAFETMYQAVRTEYDRILKRLEILKGDGRDNSAEYKELSGRKTIYGSILDLYKIYDL